VQVFVRYRVKFPQSIKCSYLSGDYAIELHVLSYLDGKCDHHHFSRLFAFVFEGIQRIFIAIRCILPDPSI